MRKCKNQTYIEGYVYEHDLRLKESGPKTKNPGTVFINGTLGVATDNDCMNVVNIHFSYVTAKTSKGNDNNTFRILKGIIEGTIGSVTAVGKEKAGMVRIDSSIDLNEWYDKDNNLISVKRNEGGFVHQINQLNENEKNRATFDVDMVITNCKRVEANEERETPEKVIVKGAIFDFKKSLLPVEFSISDPNGMDFFESLGVKSDAPVFMEIWGNQVSQTIVKTIEKESAFGDPTVREVKSSYKDFVITGAKPEPYGWDTEDSILVSEFKEIINQREIHLAEIKKNQEEYQSSRNAVPTSGGYNF